MEESNDKLNDDLEEHLNKLPQINELMERASEDMPIIAKVALDQGVSYVRDIVDRMCPNINYGDEEWNEAWGAATVTIYNILMAMIPMIDGLDGAKVDAIAVEFFLLGTQGKVEDLESLL